MALWGGERGRGEVNNDNGDYENNNGDNNSKSSYFAF